MFNPFKRPDDPVPPKLQPLAAAESTPKDSPDGPAKKPSELALSAVKMREEIRRDVSAEIAARSKEIRERVSGATPGKELHGPTSQSCPACGGSGTSPFGNMCGACAGSGMIGSG